MKTKTFIREMRLGASDVARELGIALQHLEQLAEVPGGAHGKAEELADAELCFVSLSLTATSLADQCRKAQAVVLPLET